MSMYAVMHWVRLAHAALADKGKLDAPGWTVPPRGPGAVERSLILASDSFAYTSGGLWQVYGHPMGKAIDEEDTAGLGDGVGLAWNELVPPLDPDDPDDEPYLDDRNAIEWVALTRQCMCAYCISRRSSTPVDLPAARAAWKLLETGEQRELEAQVAQAVRAWNWTGFAEPPELLVLADWLMERGADMPRLALASMVASRVR